MFKSLFSRMMFTYLSVTLGLLALLGIILARMFQSQYINEKEAELRRASSEINSIIVTKYIDDDKRPVALEELMTIARKYDALMQIRFKDSKYGAVVVVNNQSEEKWAVCENVDLTDATSYVLERNQTTTITRGMFKNVTNMPVMTLTRTIITEDNGTGSQTLGVLFLHVDMSATNSSITQIFLDVLLVSFIAVVLATFAVYYITNKMTKPIVDMNQTVMKFSRGDFDSRIKMSGRDEVSQLAMSFNYMADELNSLEDSRRSFVANVSHELRSPLTSMRGFLEAMEDGTIAKEDFNKYLNVVISENKRMVTMVNDLLDLAKIEANEYNLSIQPFDINELIRRTLLTFEARAGVKKIDVKIDFESESCWVDADPQQISQVIHNLVDNAIKFSNEYGMLLVRTRTDKNKKTAYITVKDYGQGIKEEDINYIFDRFYKEEKAHTPSGQSGTGLGLSIVKRIIDGHGGTISVKSEKGHGAEFIFTLPLSSEKIVRPKNKKKSE